MTHPEQPFVRGDRPGARRTLRAAILLSPVLAFVAGIDLPSVVVVLAVVAFLGRRRDAGWAPAAYRAIDLALVGLLVALVAIAVRAVASVELAGHVGLVLTAAWAVGSLVAAASALTADDRPGWTPLVERWVPADRP